MSARLSPLLCLALAAACTSSNPGGGTGRPDGGGTTQSASSTMTASSSAAQTSSEGTSSSSETGSSAEPSSSEMAGPSSSQGGNASSRSTAVPDAPTFTEHIRPILAESCWQCHGPTQCFGAPMPLVTYAHTQMPGAGGVTMDERMLARVTASNNTMPPGFPLSNTDQETIRRWVAQGSVEGPDIAAPTPPSGCMQEQPDAGPPTLELLAHATGNSDAYPVPQDADENVYMCFGFTVPEGPPMHITRFAPFIDNAQVVHHIVLYKDQDPQSSPSPSDAFGCGDAEGNMQYDWAFQYGWAPGTNGLTFPDDVGMPLNPGTRLVLQMHYHPTAGSPLTDRSGVRIYATPELRPNEAGMIAMGPQGFTATESSPSVTATCEVPLRYMGFSIPFTPTRIFAAFPHMHNHGVSIKAEHIRNGTTLQTFGEVTNWSFDAQPNLPTDVQLVDGDGVKVTCTYGSFDGQSVRFGEKTENEMCFEFLYVTPPIKLLQYDVPFCPL